MKKSLLILSMIFIAGCISARPTPIPAEGSPAARLYVEKCGPCHSVPHPKRHTFEEWQHILVVMKKRMKSEGMTLTPEENKVIVSYLRKNSR